MGGRHRGPWFSCLATQDSLAVALGDKELDALCGLPASHLTRFAAFSGIAGGPHTRSVALC